MLTQSCEMVDPLKLFSALREGHSNPFILETTVKDNGSGHTYISADPSFVVEIKGDGTYVDGKKASGETNPFKALKTLSRRVSTDCEKLTGGFVGYVAYDAVQNYIGGKIQEPTVFGFYEDVFVFDHSKRTLELVSITDSGPTLSDMVREAKGVELEDLHCPIDRMSTDSDSEDFMGLVDLAKDHIYAGDAFQIVLSREYSIRTDATPFQFYRNLRQVNPSPYLFLIEYGNKSIAGSSPETMASVEGNIVKINPIAGTARRGHDLEEDAELATRLLADEKERAEHIMLVDLARNDIGKICEPRSISIPTLMKVRGYSHVQHMESEVTGRLREGRTVFDAIESSFPAGTLTGAPKMRAMEIINELERSRRRVYGGCVGYFSTNGCADTAIAIRMAEFDDSCRVRAGAGIVADSDPEAEYNETERKMSAMFTAFDREGGR
ncbi:MAG: anthranilate synthase component I [Candidatus Methanofastidiosa archaeon]|nr:anthranilate synthase component I [Candidatus Methanofastidiosa archaeon]